MKTGTKNIYDVTTRQIMLNKAFFQETLRCKIYLLCQWALKFNDELVGFTVAWPNRFYLIFQLVIDLRQNILIQLNGIISAKHIVLAKFQPIARSTCNVFSFFTLNYEVI